MEFSNHPVAGADAVERDRLAQVGSLQFRKNGVFLKSPKYGWDHVTAVELVLANVRWHIASYTVRYRHLHT
jgi:hypothetical protein